MKLPGLPGKSKTMLGSDPVVPQRSVEDKDPMEGWSPVRRTVAIALKSMVTEAVLALLVLISFILVVIETDSEGAIPQWVTVTNNVLLVLYTIELLTRLFVLRLEFFYFFFNVMDLLVILLDLVSTGLELIAVEELPSLTVLRVFRVLRLARSYKVMVKFPQLALMVKGLANAASAVMYGVALVFMVITVWSILAVQFIHPVNQRVGLTGAYDGCGRCAEAFSSVRQSVLTFTQQIICGDSWGLVTIPIIEEAPATAWFFAAVFITVQLTIVNVMLAVIVDTALKTSQDDLNQIVQHKTDEFNHAAQVLIAMCRQLDGDGSGDLTLDELLSGIDGHKDFRDQLLAMDIRKEDMSLVFNILDADGSGSVNYEEFVTELFKMKSHDSHTLLVFIKHYVTDIKKSVDEQLHVMKADIMNKIQESTHLGDTGLLDKMADELEAPASPARASPPPEEKKLSLAAGRAESVDDLGEELRRLRNVISEDLVRSMKYMAERSETHTRLLASIARDSPLLGSDLTMPMSDLAGPDAPKGDVARAPLWGAGPGLQAPLQGGSTDVRAVPPTLQPMPSSSWGLRNCCSVQRDRRQDASNLNNLTYQR